jgi:hypothetical protein
MRRVAVVCRTVRAAAGQRDGVGDHGDGAGQDIALIGVLTLLARSAEIADLALGNEQPIVVCLTAWGSERGDDDGGDATAHAALIEAGERESDFIRK